MIYTKKEFKKLWESNDNGGGITFNDIADCAKDWKLYSTPRAHHLNLVSNTVLLAAGCGTYSMNGQELSSCKTNENLEQT
jgi:hypothetical protein